MKKIMFKPTSETNQKSFKLFQIIALVILFAAAGFFGGIYFQKHRGITNGIVAGNRDNQFNRSGSPGGMMSGQRPSSGTVTAVSSSNISVKDSQSGESTAYKITDSTKVMDSGETASINDIKVDDKVMIMASNSDSKEAAQIMLNPQEGRFNGPMQGS